MRGEASTVLVPLSLPTVIVDAPRADPCQVHIAPDGSWLATTGPTNFLGGAGDPVVRIWDPATGRQRHQFDTGHTGGVGQVHIARDGTALVASGGMYASAL